MEYEFNKYASDKSKEYLSSLQAQGELELNNVLWFAGQLNEGPTLEDRLKAKTLCEDLHNQLNKIDQTVESMITAEQKKSTLEQMIRQSDTYQ